MNSLTKSLLIASITFVLQANTFAIDPNTVTGTNLVITGSGSSLVITGDTICIGCNGSNAPNFPPSTPGLGPTITVNVNNVSTVNATNIAQPIPTIPTVVNTITGNYGSNAKPITTPTNMLATTHTCDDSGVEMVRSGSCIDYSGLNAPAQATMFLMQVGNQVIIEGN